MTTRERKPPIKKCRRLFCGRKRSASARVSRRPAIWAEWAEGGEDCPPALRVSSRLPEERVCTRCCTCCRECRNKRLWERRSSCERPFSSVKGANARSRVTSLGGCSTVKAFSASAAACIFCRYSCSTDFFRPDSISARLWSRLVLCCRVWARARKLFSGMVEPPFCIK